MELKAMSLLGNHDPITPDNPQTLFRAVSCRNYFLSSELHPSTVLQFRGKRASTHRREALVTAWVSRLMALLQHLLVDASILLHSDTVY